MPDTYPLGRIAAPDSRDAAYPASLHLMTVAADTIVSKSWPAAALRINQGQEGTCVGHAGENWLGAKPIMDKISHEHARFLYDECKKVDGLPSGTEGTTDHALARVLVAEGRIERYLWAQGPNDFQQWLSHVGPIMVGTNWYESMFTPAANGMISLSGVVVGGHEYLIRRLDVRNHRALLRNSWGADWGLKGEAWINLDDLFRLVFDEGGDALCAVEKRIG